MRLVVLSDAHGNIIFFEKCMEAIKENGFDRVVCLGDCFGYMRDGNAVLNELRNLDSTILMGNHEAMMIGRIGLDKEKEKIYGLRSDLCNISRCNYELLKKMKPECYEQIDGKKILFVHGSPKEPLVGYLYENDREYQWEQNVYDFVFMGHTHRPYLKKVGSTMYINVGSCGLPRDIGAAPSYAVFDTKTGKVLLHRLFIREDDIKTMALKKVHPKVWECLMRGRIR